MRVGYVIRIRGRGGHFEILSYWKDANMSMLQSIGGGSDLVLSCLVIREINI